jgi:hypothetical protein
MNDEAKEIFDRFRGSVAAVQSKLHVRRHRVRKALHAREPLVPTNTTLQPHLQVASLANVIGAASFCCAAFAASLGGGGFCSHVIRLHGVATASCDNEAILVGAASFDPDCNS